MPINSKFISRKEYKEALLNFDSKNITVYQNLQWSDIVKEGFLAKLIYVCSVNENNLIVALTCFTTKKRGPFRLIGSPLRGTFTPYAGPIFEKNLDNKIKIDIIYSLHNLIKNNYDYIELGSKNFQSLNTIMPILGYKKSLRYTQLIDLSVGEKLVWSSMEGRARNMIRKAEKLGVCVTCIKPDQRWIEKYFEILTVTFSRQGLNVPHPISFYKELIKLENHGLIRYICAKYKGEIVSAGIFVIDSDHMYFLSGTSNELGMKTAASSLVQWHSIKLGIKDGLNIYDMGGLGEPKIDKFKKSFGGNQISYMRWVKRSWLFALLEPLAIYIIKIGLLKRSGI